MALFDFLKSKKEIERSRKSAKPLAAPKRPVSEKKEAVVITKKAVKENYDVLRNPHITEKSTVLSENNEYIFKISQSANKTQVKEAVRNIYGVDVVKVRIINIHRKRKRFGKNMGWSKGYKKAIVSVKEGQKIEILPR